MHASVTIRRRAQVALSAHAYAYTRMQEAVVLKQQMLSAFWRSICDACMDEIDECSAAISCDVEPLQTEILKGNADLYRAS
ncbi:hypothetical protein NG829_08335 [Xanthomonas sacchari]|uniref:Uncharacterized protein n=1 Tax=Xanthomonas sacchari TaxID=56458 RepID=A0ABT3DTB2_9XANT|nr:hypothetical protein [Xanthomonas sacchari]MCW0398743.1 hypothetical protein [Xanthomonas sacchari]MCW0418391.1 hypothetical protein [Xanthomonas sacchari]UYK72548.1 hypothetical protein NG828_20565 [Xanthomonas sacchari]UYK82283.1 hypothetical protein NG829_08335 [Xanthomonas sacchari]